MRICCLAQPLGRGREVAHHPVSTENPGGAVIGSFVWKARRAMLDLQLPLLLPATSINLHNF